NQGRNGGSTSFILESLVIEHGKAFERYRPKQYDGDVLLIRTKKQLAGLLADRRFLGWKDTLTNVKVCELAGHRQNILVEPNARRLDQEATGRLKSLNHPQGDGTPTTAGGFE